MWLGECFLHEEWLGFFRTCESVFSRNAKTTLGVVFGRGVLSRYTGTVHVPMVDVKQPLQIAVVGYREFKINFKDCLKIPLHFIPDAEKETFVSME